MVRVYNKSNMKTKNENYTNFQRYLLATPKCPDCIFGECKVLFDAHHDEYFSESCGLVIMQSGVYLVDYVLEDEWE